MRRLFYTDWILFSAVYLVLGIGLLALFSLSKDLNFSSVFARQFLFAALGSLLLFSSSALDSRYISKLSTPLYFFTIALLVAVLVFGSVIRGTSGWIQIAGFQFQPVEFSKVVLIVFLASFISQKRSELGDLVRLIVSLLLTAFLVLLVLRQPDFGSALVLAGIWFGMVVVSGIRKRYLVLLLVLFVALAGAAWFLFAPYQRDRILTFLNPTLDPRGSGYNVIQSLVAVGSGGLTGKGLGHGSQSQSNFLPERHTDFIFAVIAEELGFFGVSLLLFLFGVILFRMSSIAASAKDNFSYLAIVGVILLFCIQITVNVGMNVGLLPVTGIPLPLVSYGGSSLLSTFLALALVRVLAFQRKTPDSYEWTGGYGLPSP